MALPTTFTALAHLAAQQPPRAAIVLGSGQGEVSRHLAPHSTVPFSGIPGLPTSSVAGHRGTLTLGDWAGQRVLVYAGRLHFYEGHSWDDVVRPIYIAHQLGARILLLTNAAGGIRADLHPGSLLLLRDHVEWTRPWCWRWPGLGGLGPSRASPYSTRLLELLQDAGRARGQELTAGVYAALTGPCYETPAEIRALRTWGADAVGMSTAREIQTGCDLGMECAAISLITNRAAGLSATALHHGEVLETAARAGERLGELIEEFLRLLGAA